MSKEVAQVTSQEPFTLAMERPNSDLERIGIRNDYPETPLARKLFQSLGVMFLVSPYLPRKITTDFFVPEGFRNLIASMYESAGHEKPLFALTERKLARGYESLNISGETDNSRAALAYSGGKDSMWNLNWLLREKGRKNVLAVHFQGMNRGVAKAEHEGTLRQEKKIGFNLKVIDLLNSSKQKGKQIMRARDMFIVGTIIPLALEFKAANIFLEGGYWPKGTPEGHPFTTYEASWEIFNKLLSGLGIPVQAGWKDADGIKAIKDIAKNHPDWLSLIQNCFSPPDRKPQRREKWRRIAPTFLLLKDQCGSCSKCLELNLARITYDPRLNLTKPEDIKTYLKYAIRWTKEHRIDMMDIIAGAFNDQLALLSKKYGLLSFYQKNINA